MLASASSYVPGSTTSTRSGRIWFIAAPSFLVFWIAGLGFMWWMVIPPLLFLMRPVGGRKVSGPGLVLICIGVALTLSLAAGTLAGATEVNRVPGAAYAAVVWISAGLLYSVLNSINRAQFYNFVRGVVFVSAVQGALSLIAVLLHPSPLSQFPLPTSGILGNAGGVAPWVRANLAYDAWFGDLVVRSSGVQATSAWAGGLACIVLLLLVLKRRALIMSGMSNAWWLIATLLSALSLHFAYSRVSDLILFGILGYYLLGLLSNKAFKSNGRPIAALLAIAVAVCTVVIVPWSDVLQEQDSLRPGSSETRFSSYMEGFSAASSSGPLVFMLGSGAKPYLEELGLGAGSESTYVSLLVRGGLVCLSLFVAFFLLRLRETISTADSAGTALLCALAVHAVVEDLDVGTLTLMLGMLNFSRLDNISEDPPDHAEG